MKAINALFLLATLGLPAVHAADHPAGAAAASTSVGAPLSEGEIRKVDKVAGKVTIRHGPLENLGMPAMTMVFRVKNPAMLDQVKPGDKVRFLAEKADGAFTVTRLEVVTP